MLAPLPPSALPDTLRHCRLLAVVGRPEARTAAALARALWRGGIRGMEVTFRTPEAAEAIQAIREAEPGMCLGAGTLLHVSQVREALEAGAHYGVAPGCHLPVIEAAQAIGLPFAPGIATPTEIETALAAGCRVLKFFPAQPSGGPAYLRAISEPYAHLAPVYLPLGGIELETAIEYLRSERVAAVGGSWLIPPRAVAEGDWSAIEAGAATAVKRIGEALA